MMMIRLDPYPECIYMDGKGWYDDGGVNPNAVCVSPQTDLKRGYSALTRFIYTVTVREPIGK